MRYPRTVYAIRHNKTNRVYVGSSYKPERRIEEHKRFLKKGCHSVADMQADYNQYGDDYTIEYLEVIERFEDRSHEYEWMRRLKSHNRGTGYNYEDRVFTRKKDPRVTYRNEIKEAIKQIDDLGSLDLILQIATKMVKRNAADAQRSS